MEIKSLIQSLARKDAFYHWVFWITLLILMFFTSISSMDWWTAVITDVVNIGFYALICYINLVILFPQYLKDKNLLLHFGALALVSLLVTPIKTYVLFLGSSGDTVLQNYYLSNKLFIFLSTFFIGISSTVYKVMTDWIIQQRIKSDLVNQNLQSELKFLKSQINPHFLFNTLNSLYALTLKKSDLAPEIVLKLSEMMRYMLYECNEREVYLQKEINYMQNYLELEKLRHGARMQIDLKVQGDIKDQKISPLLLIPFIENSFKHGLNNQISKGFVHLELHVVEDQLLMLLENSKSNAIPKLEDKRSGGIGLVNVKRRMAILYPDSHQLDIVESPNKYKVELNLSLHSHTLQTLKY